MKAVIYARYSCEGQRDESIDGQIRECEAYASRSGIDIVGRYIDRALSAKTDNRPQFQQMIKDSAKGDFEAIIVWKLDRFARNRYDSAHYKALLRKNGVKVVSATESISEGAEGIILESVLEGMAEYYSAELAEKVIRGQTENAMKCKFNGGTVPFGYYIDSDKHFQINSDIAPYIIAAFEKYENGATLKDIADYFNIHNVKNAHGKSWKIQTVHNMLTNRRYIGEYKYRDIVTPGGIPSIISAEQFERVQMIIQRNAHRGGKYHAGEEYILSTKLYCGDCMALMLGESGTNYKGYTYRYYKCYNSKHTKTCKKKAVKKDWIEHLVADQIIKAISNEKNVTEIIKRLTKYQELEYKEIPMLKKEIASLNSSIENLLNAIEQGIITDSTKARLKELEEKKKQAEVELIQFELQKPQYSEEQYRAFFEKYAHANISNKKERTALINYFLNCAVLYDDKLLIFINSEKRGIVVDLTKLEGFSPTDNYGPPTKSQSLYVVGSFVYIWNCRVD